jgi:predicted HTH transcriptional regulator
MAPTASEVAERIAEREGKALEFKRGLPGDAKVARTLCAFANTRGGLLLVGVGDRGELVGAPRPPETVARLRAVARERLEPPLEVLAGTVELEGRRITWCSVPLSPGRPHAALDDAGQRTVLVRVGASNRRASGATLAAIRAQRAAGRRPDALQRAVLSWIEARGRRGPPGGDATVRGFAEAHNVGVQRARRAFTQLEQSGRLVGHGAGARRVYALP